MSAISEISTPIASAPAARRPDKLAMADLDKSVSAAVMVLYFFAIVWLVGWSVLHLVLSIKLLSPGFLGECSWLSFGRLKPVASNMFAYGWASCAGMGTSLWLMARLCRVKLGSPLMVIIGTLFWNVGLAAGLVALHAGNLRSLEYLELPGWSHAIMLGGFSMIAVWIIVLFQHRPKGPGFVTQMYIVAAFIWLAWSMIAANIFGSLPWVKGVSLAINGAWFFGNFQGLWFTALGLGAVYYLIPKVTGKPIHSYYLANLGFWSLAFLYGWTGLQRYNGGPIPAWLITLSIVATALTIIPVATVAVNHHLTMIGSHSMMHYSPTLRFTVVGAMCYTVSAMTGILTSLRSVNEKVGLTWSMVAQNHLVLYAFYSMVMFGAIYFIVPRLVRREWVSSTFIKFHFWGVAYGIGLTILLLAIAGLFQGAGWNTPAISSEIVSQITFPLLRGSILAGALLLFGHLVFALHFLLMAARLGQVSAEPTLMASKYPEAH